VPDPSALIDRGIRAQKLLHHELLLEARESIRKALLDKIESSPVRDTEGREKLYLMLKALNDVWGYLEQAVNTGKVEIHLRDEKRRFSLFKTGS
jgi:hypothetical protein